MFAVRLIAIAWFASALYILVTSRFSPGLFGAITAALAIPASIGILLRKNWAILPAMLLCLAWAFIAVLLMIKGAGPMFNYIMLLLAAVSCGVPIVHWHRTGRGRKVWFERS